MSLADVWAMNTWAVMMMVTQNVSDSSCCTVVRFSHEDTRTRTQRRSFVTVQHEDYLLFIKWKWLIEGLHPPLLTKAEEEEGLVLLSWEWGGRDARGRGRGLRGGQGGTLGGTLWKPVIISI